MADPTAANCAASPNPAGDPTANGTTPPPSVLESLLELERVLTAEIQIGLDSIPVAARESTAGCRSPNGSRRIIGYCTCQWVTGSGPWEPWCRAVLYL